MKKFLVMLAIVGNLGFTYKGSVITGDIVELYYGHGVDTPIPVEEYKEAGMNASHCWGVNEAGGMVAYPDSGTSYQINDGPFLTYEVHFPATGTYYLWIEGEQVTPASDSVHFGIDGNLTGAITFLYGTWSNTKQAGGKATITVSTIGPHLLNIWMREDGSVIKKIIITQSSTFNPVTATP